MTIHVNMLPENKRKRKNKASCYACREWATVNCDKSGCGRIACNLHGRWWKGTQHLCLECARQEGL